MNTQTEDGGGAFLNIKQAAAFLNVSEISLRRWTNSGRLPCVRVGKRRERRFRKNDLLAFVEARDGVGESAEPRTGSRESVALLEGLSVADGSHLCTVYDDAFGRIKLSVPFLRTGLRQGELCLLIGADDARDHILGALAQTGVDVEQETQRGRLVVGSGAETTDAMYAKLETIVHQAVLRGEPGMRLVGDMAWTLTQDIETDALMAFEHRYQHDVAGRFPIVALCQYDARKFSGRAILHAMKCHTDNADYPLAPFLC